MELLKKLPQTDLFPQGWLKRQLELQAAGLSGNIGRVFSDLSDDNAWLGGKGEAWERGPYYLDGLVPLAFLLKDGELIKKAGIWVEAILRSGNADVGFGPRRSVDYWPRMVAQKALISYYRATSDERIIPFLLDYYRFMLKNIDKYPPFYWASARAQEGMEAMLEVYEITGDKTVPRLIEKLKEYGYDWLSYFEDFKYVRPMTKYTSRAIFKLGKAIGEPIDRMVRMSRRIPKPKNKEQTAAFNNNKLVKLIMLTHGVNIAMAYKYPVLYGLLDGNADCSAAVKAGFERVMRHHGLSVGLHSCDEHLMGGSAASGVELCAVAEQCYSFEEALRLTRDGFFADWIEYYIFNAFPATFTQDMCAHQYVQQPNQIAADRKRRQFFDTNKEANIFGVAPNFGCCAANMHQGFPKFAENLAYTDGKKLFFMVFSPFKLDTIVGGNRTVITQTADYPFENKIVFEAEQASEQEIAVRIPRFTRRALFNGAERAFERGGIMSLVVNGGDRLELELEDGLTAFDNADGSVSIRRNNLLFAMPLPFEERYVRGERPFHYREYIGGAPFAFAPIIECGAPVTTEAKSRRPDMPFDRRECRIEYTVKAKRVTNWAVKKNSAPSPPEQPVTADGAEIPIVPYGCTYLRITQFPKIEEKDVRLP